MSNSIVILCVDDEVTALAVRRLLLSSAGYAVLTATNSDAALGLLRLNHVDLVITDSFVFHPTGEPLACAMKQVKPEVPIILFTALVEQPPDSRHADLLLTKGITPPELLAAIAKLVTKENPPAPAS